VNYARPVGPLQSGRRGDPDDGAGDEVLTCAHVVVVAPSPRRFGIGISTETSGRSR
jgi:hypothetical protein